ncbi:outer membrane beta-barrel protein [Simiduia aestuariiviva]|uniref:Outer membrane protein beta-barrel domain-containing protein n=1 Tax=Simiduia aestuariiviva TaxID=1510459 RepID=A0A839UQZ9_9GAMM|nr:outer membrane beta-barrel protein [Simiduia aestuariiviva]MBB3168930.1 hypothetical protein [Simiduia aestuariiviva]
MQNITRTLHLMFSVMCLAGLSTLAMADQKASKSATNKAGIYLGIKGIYTDLAPEATENAGGLGVLMAEHYANGLGVEVELNRSQADVNLLDLNTDYTLDTAGLYGVYRSPGALYVKVRGGLLWKRISVGNDSTNKTGFGGGIGGGYDFGTLLLEAEYTYVDKDITQIGVSLIGKF